MPHHVDPTVLHQWRFLIAADFPEASSCASLLASAILQADWPICASYALGQVVEALIPIIVTRHRLIASGDGVGA